MKEKIKQFVVSKGWLLVLTGIATFVLALVATWAAMAVLFVLFVAQAFAYTRWS